MPIVTRNALKRLVISSFSEDAVLHGLLYVENLTAQGQDGLELAVAALLGCTAGRVTLDYKQFAIFGCTR